MDENNRQEFVVDGFCFGSEEDFELAKHELKTVSYIDKRIENRSFDTVKSVYMGCIEKQMFRTPVGYAYLHDLKEKMEAMGGNMEDIPSIPLFQIFGTLPEITVKERTVTVPKKKDRLVKKNARLTLAVVVLVFLVIAMFVISLTGSNPTVLNYKYALENEYSDWEQSLKEREDIIRQKERELNLGNIVDDGE